MPNYPVRPIIPIEDQLNQRDLLEAAVEQGEQRALAAGYVPKSQQSGERVDVIFPDGDTGTVPVENLNYALQNGFKLDTPFEKEVRRRIEEIEGSPGGGALDLGAKQFVNQALFGVPEIVENHTSSDIDKEVNRRLSESHPIANAVGGVGGFATSLLYGGPIFKGATTAGRAVEGAIASRLGDSLGARLLANSARVATEGGVLAAPQALTESAFGDHEKAAESLLYGIGLGGILGLAGQGVSELASSALKSAKGPLASNLQGIVNEYAENQAFKSLNPLKATSREASRIKGPSGALDVGRTLLDRNLVRDVSVIGGEDFAEYVNRLSAEKEKVGQEISNMYKDLDLKAGPQNTGIKADVLVDKMEQEILKPLTKTPGYKNIANEVKSYINDFKQQAASIPGDLGFQQLHQWRSALDDISYRYGKLVPNPIEKELQSIRTIIQKELETKGEAVAKKFGQEFIKPLKLLNKDYRNLTIAEKSAKEFATGSELSNRNFSLTDYIYGGAALSNAASLAFHGHPLGALTTLLAAPAHRLLREKGNAFAAKFANNLGLSLSGKAITAVNSKLNTIPVVLKKLSDKGITPSTISLDAIPKLLGNDKKSRQNNFKELSNAITQSMSNQDMLTTNVGNMAKVIGVGAPNIASTFNGKTINALSYLYKELPKPTSLPTPFNNQNFKPSDKQLSDFEQKVEIVANPFAVIDHLASNTLTNNHIAALKAVYPALYNSISNEVINYSSKNNKTMPYQTRLKLSLLLGTPLDASLKNKSKVKQYQSFFGNYNQQGKNSKINWGDLQTSTQKMSNK